MCGWPYLNKIFSPHIGCTKGALYGDTSTVFTTFPQHWPPQHIPVVGGVGRCGLIDLRDGDLAILGLPALGRLLDLPSFALGGRILDLYVDVGHCSRRFLPS